MNQVLTNMKLGLVGFARWGGAVRAGALVILALLVAMPALAPAHAQQGGGDKEEDEKQRSISEKVAEPLQKAIEELNVEEGLTPDYAKAIEYFDKGLAVKKITGYELFVLLQYRGSVKYQTEDVDGALADFERALNEGEMRTNERLSLLYNVGQLHLMQEDFRSAVTYIEEWIAGGGEVTSKIHLNMVYSYSELNELRNSLRHARAAYAVSELPRERAIYDTLNYLYSELNMPRDRLRLVLEMVSVFPAEKDLWLLLASLYDQQGQGDKVFEVYKSMYTNGLLVDEDEIIRLIEYYSFNEVPYHGARIMQREMNAGRLAKTVDHYDSLARYYKQAREFERAISPLREAASRASSGQRFFELGESFYYLGRLEEAETALLEAVDKGGLDNTGKAYEYLGASLFERSDADETLDETVARMELAAEWYEKSGTWFAENNRRRAEEKSVRWVEYIGNTISDRLSRRQTEIDTAFTTIRIACNSVDATLRQTLARQGLEVGDVRPILKGIDCDALEADEFAYKEQWLAQTEWADEAGPGSSDEPVTSEG